MNKKILLLATALAFSAPCLAGLPDALMSLNYKQYGSALSEFQTLANEGNVSAFYYLGRMYQNGWGVPENIPLATQYFQMADEHFYLPAAAQLGKILLYGDKGVPANPKVAIDLLKKAALSGDSEALFELGNAAVSGLGGDPNFNNAFGFYLSAALKGDKKAQFQLGQMYLTGRGIPQNFEKAMLWMKRSANQGYVRAQLELAYQTENNPKLRNLGSAYAWNSILAAYNSDQIGEQAAQKRDLLASKLKGKNLNEQQAAIRSWIPKTPEESVPKEEAKAETPIIFGFNDPKTLQQILLNEGSLPRDTTEFGLTQEMIDIAEATKDTLPIENAIQKAMKRGQKEAAAYYGDLLHFRLKQSTEALKWYQQGAAEDDDYAKYQLAKAYCEGWGVSPDASKCYGWLLTTEETKDPVLNALVQQALLTVRSSANPNDLRLGQAHAKSLQENAEKEKKEKKLLDFF